MTRDAATFGALALAAARAGAAAIGAVVAAGPPPAQVKSAGHDLVTAADRASEAAAIRTILASRPDDAVLGEETGGRAGTTGVRWLIDPLDGTANFVHGRPDHAVSVGVEVDGVVAGGAVVRPVTGEWAATGADGLRVGNGRDHEDPAPRRLSEVRAADALVAVGMPYPLADRRRVLRMLGEVALEVRGLRVMGSAAADLLAVARGRADAFVGVGLAVWDTAAGQALVEAAGGTVRRVDLAGLDTMVAGPTSLVDDLVGLLRSAATR